MDGNYFTATLLQTVPILLLINWLSACTSSVGSLHESGSKTLKQVMVQNQSEVMHQVPLWADSALAGFSRTQATELDNTFPLFPNPTIYIYIDPHITVDGLPIMGMSTKTRMFKKDHYALQHEVMALSRK
jgi:conjugative transfer region lipoprotein (TIGR03751 family)